MAFPRFAPDAELVVDIHNGPEHWTGAEWNAYVAAAERNRNMVTARLIECPAPVLLPAFDERDAESTSAALRRVEQERDEANELCDKVAAELRLVTRERDSLARRCALRFEERDLARAELASARQELDAVRTARDNLGRELAEARATIIAYASPGWIVDRDGGRYCERCEQEVRRGEAYELQPGTGGPGEEPT